MIQSPRFMPAILDTTGAPVDGASIEVRRQGATIKGNQSSSSSPHAYNVEDVGAIVQNDEVAIDNGTTTYTVTAVDLSDPANQTITLAFSGTLAINDEQRLTPTNNLPTLYNDSQLSESVSNPLTTGSDGLPNLDSKGAWTAHGGFFDYLLSGGTITTNRLVQDAYIPSAYPEFYAKDARYGLAWDGATDDSTAMQKILDEIKANGGGRLVLPAGDCYIATGLTYAANNLVIEGGGGSGYGNTPDGTSAFVTDQAIVMLTLGDASTSRKGGATIRNVSFRDTTGNTATGGIEVLRLSNCHFDNLNFSNFQTSYGIQFDATGDAIDNCTIVNMKADDVKFGVKTVGAVKELVFVGGFLDGGQIASSIGLEFATTGGFCRVLGTTLADYVTGVKISGGDHCYIQGRFYTTGVFTGLGVQVANTSDHNTIEGSSFRNCSPAIQIDTGATLTNVGFNSYNNTTTDVVTDAGTETNMLAARSDSNTRTTQLAPLSTDALTVAGVVSLTGTVTSTGATDVTALTVGRQTGSGTALDSGDFTLDAEWGTTASIAVQAGSTDLCGAFTVTPGGSGIATAATVTLTFADGAFAAAPFCVATRGTDAGVTSPALGWTVATTTTTAVFSYSGGSGLPVSGDATTCHFIIMGA